MMQLANSGNVVLAADTNVTDDDICHVQAMYPRLAVDCAVLKGATPIGAQIRKAHNGMAHIDGGTSIDDIKRMCNQVIRLSGNLYPEQ
jgi:hypothetical protein